MKVELVDHCGTDLSVVNAARVSFDKQSKWEETPNTPGSGGDYSVTRSLKEADKRLIQFLARGMTTDDFEKFVTDVIHAGDGGSYGDDRAVIKELLWQWRRNPTHFTPFAHPHVSFRCKAPIFIARQLEKHQVGFTWSEVSRRYVDSEPEFYVPDRWRLAAENVKQGSSGVAMEINKAFKKNVGPKNHRRTPCTAKFANWKARATREGTEFSITQDDIPWVTNCPILGIELDWELGHGKGIKKNSPTLDRIDNTKGYVPHNVMVISSLANSMKNMASPEELVTFSRSMLTQYAGTFMDHSQSVDGYYENMRDIYRRLIDSGMCAEQARMFMPQSMYTEWLWTGSLYGWANVYNQRKPGSHAQREVWPFAQALADHMARLFPVSWAALTGCGEALTA